MKRVISQGEGYPYANAMTVEQSFREALRTLVFRWSSSVATDEIIRELKAEIEVLETTTLVERAEARDDH